MAVQLTEDQKTLAKSKTTIRGQIGIIIASLVNNINNDFSILANGIMEVSNRVDSITGTNQINEW